MIDHAGYVSGVVRDELAAICAARGIPEADAGYAIGGQGAVGVVVVNGKPELVPRWSVLISLGSLLPGKPPIAGSLPVVGVIPPDGAFRAAVQRLVTELDGQRQAEASDG